MALSHKDWELPKSRIWMAEIDIDRGLDFPMYTGIYTENVLKWKSCKLKWKIMDCFHLKTFKTLRIPSADTTITSSLTIPQEVVKLSSNRQWVSRNICLASRQAQEETLSLKKSRRNTTLAQPRMWHWKIRRCVLCSIRIERSSWSDSSSPECVDIKLPNWAKGHKRCTELHYYIATLSCSFY